VLGREPFQAAGGSGASRTWEPEHVCRSETGAEKISVLEMKDVAAEATCRTPHVRQAYSSATDARQAAREFYEGVAQPEMEFVLFYCSNDYDQETLAAELRNLFAGVQVIGCTSAGEIGPGGYCERGLTGASFAGEAFCAVTGRIGNLQQFEASVAENMAQRLMQELERKAPEANAENTFALLLIDGLSVREEQVARSLQATLGRIPLAGGSAADGLNFAGTAVFLDGQFWPNSAIVLLATTPLPFTVFKTQHFSPTDQRLVITGADAARRTITEINGLPAAEEYARLLGIEVDDLDPHRYASTPVVVLIDGSNYVRSIQKTNPDGSMTMLCAIDEGVVLRLGQGSDMVQNLEQAIGQVKDAIGPPQVLLAYDCFLRRLEILQRQIDADISRVLLDNNAVGFSTYGEQFCGIHVNQTMTGIAIGYPRGAHA